MTLIETISIVSPFVSAILAGYISYRYTIKHRKLEVLYENKLPAFKEIYTDIEQFRQYCIGRVASFEGNEYAAFYEQNPGALEHRIEIAKSFGINGIFLSSKSRIALERLLHEMGSLCNIEADPDPDYHSSNKGEYDRLEKQVQNVIQLLYSELNLVKE